MSERETYEEISYGFPEIIIFVNEAFCPPVVLSLRSG